MVGEAAARKELLDSYKGIEKAEYFEDYVKISAALGSGLAGKGILEGLRALEAALIDRIVKNYHAKESAREQLASSAMEHWDARRKTYWNPNEKKPEKEEELRHVLTATLERHELDYGFRQSGAKVPVYVGILQSAVFIQALKERRHWKDVGAGPVHGEFTHRIQWYLLSKGGALPPLNKHPAKVFSTLGNYWRGNLCLWDDLCDRRAEDCVDKNDWRRPENLNIWLTSSSSTCETLCPVLSTFLGFRNYKRGPIPAYVRKKLGLVPAKDPTILDFKKNKYKIRT